MQHNINWDDFRLTVDLLASVNEECIRQDQLWGEQNHPLRPNKYQTHFSGSRLFTRGYYENEAALWKAANDARVEGGALGWDGILLEEVFEALAEDDAERAITELIQVAAVALSAAKSIRRNGLDGA